MKRIIVSSAIGLIILILALSGYYYSQKYAVIHSNPIDAIPTDAAWFIELKNAKSGVEQLSNTSFFKSISKDSSFSIMKKSFHWLDSISGINELSTDIWQNQKLYISAHPTKANDFDLLYTCNLPSGKSENDITNFIEDLTDKIYTKSERVYEAVKIHELTLNNESIYTFAISKGVFIFSRTSFLVEDAIRQLKSGNSFAKSKTFNKTGIKFGADESILLFVNHYGLHDMLTGYINSEKTGFLESLNNFCRWSRFSFLLQKNSIGFKGISSSIDTTDLFSSIHGLTTSVSRIGSVAPARTAFLLDISVSNIDQCLNKLRANGKFFISESNSKFLIDSLSRKLKLDLRKSMTSWNNKEISLLITEPGSLDFANNTYAFIRSDNTGNALELLEKIQSAAGKIKGNEKYRSHQIESINIIDLVPLFFGNMFLDIQNTYFTNIKDFIIFANSPTILKSMIDDYEDKKTLDKETDYISHVKESTLSSQINIYFNLQRGTNILRSISNEGISPMLINDGIYKKTIQSIALSFETKNELTTSKGRIDFSGNISKEIHLLWSSQLDTTAATPPFVINNGENKYIAIQDQKYYLNLFNEGGKLVWKKPFGEKIISDIYSIDQYNNGECQIIFNSERKLFIIDINGDSIRNFPIRLPAQATNGCLVKDFDGNNKSEIYVACANGTIYGYEVSGKPLTQFNFRQPIYGINRNFIPFRLNNTDYFLASSEENQYIVDRKGKVVKLKSPTNPVLQSTIALRDSGKTCRIYLLDNVGNLFTLDPAKTTELNALNLELKFSGISSYENPSEDEVILLNENKVYNYSEKEGAQLISEFKTGKNFTIVNSINSNKRIGITEINENKFYLLSNHSTIEDGYPVWGSSKFSLLKGDDDFAQDYIVIANGDGVVYLYGE